MFELMLMRHAKSDWNTHTSDVDRPLNNRGVRDALRMGEHLNKINLVPDRMVISGAQRTQETAELLLKNILVPEENIIVDSELYLADRETLIEVIESYIDKNKRLLVLAHNPGMDDVVSYLSSEKPSLSESGKLMTTCAVAWFHVDSTDALNKPGQASLKKLIRPKEIE